MRVELEKLKEWSDKSEVAAVKIPVHNFTCDIPKPQAFPEELFYVLRTVHILRRRSVGLGINFSCAEQWTPITEEVMYVARRLTCIFCYGPSSNDTRNRPRLVESPYCVAGSVQDWIGRWKERFLWKEKL
ncbi:hypothetical protein KY289_024126 [Solanum tuberosum]|nr:hypothetical protein KY289_024126 [Solanum tuberosum]